MILAGQNVEENLNSAYTSRIEKEILAAIIDNGAAAYVEASKVLDAYDFSHICHTKIFQVIGEMVKKNRPIDYALIQEFMNGLAAISQGDFAIRTVNDNLTNMLTAAKYEHMRRPLDLIIFDHLQLIEVEKIADEYNAVRKVSKELKALAMALNVPVLVLSQLNRKVEERQDKRPMMADLRGNGSIEQDADFVSFLYRDAYYNKDTADENLTEFIIGKNRFGQTGMLRFNFVADTHSFFAR